MGHAEINGGGKNLLEVLALGLPPPAQPQAQVPPKGFCFMERI